MNFLKFTPLYVALSTLVIGAGLLSLAVNGIHLSVDFTGGSLLELQLPSTPADSGALISEVQSLPDIETVSLSETNLLSVKALQLSSEEKQQIIAQAEKAAGAVTVSRFDVIGPTISAELLKKTAAAILVVAVFITWYVGRQFDELKYGVCAVLAMVHDSLVLIGSFSIFGYLYGVEVDVLFVTAVLTTLSFSVHDTIVVYHRIRELRLKHPGESLPVLINYAVAGTITRSINNSLTIIFMLLALVLLGGATIKWFAVALLVGAITGTYSSAAVALPLLLAWESVEKKLRARRLQRV